MVIAAEACGRWKFPTLPQKNPKKQKQKQETKIKKKEMKCLRNKINVLKNV